MVFGSSNQPYNRLEAARGLPGSLVLHRAGRCFFSWQIGAPVNLNMIIPTSYLLLIDIDSFVWRRFVAVFRHDAGERRWGDAFGL